MYHLFLSCKLKWNIRITASLAVDAGQN
uniref:Uncharacterized protein n=1 Tax=Arundo donax TaxID=35708 RepID=A0A0A8XYF4_ARUDO